MTVDVRFLDVGQGDSTLVADRSTGLALLIDCPAGGSSTVMQALQDLGNPRVVAAVLTHWDSDHYGGILEVMRRTPCDAFYYNHETIVSSMQPDNMLRAALLALLGSDLNKTGKRSAKASDGDVMGAVEWSMLAPSHVHLTQAMARSDRNLASGVVRIRVGSWIAIVGGDADPRVWSQMHAEQTDLRADVLRWPHHGSLGRQKVMAPFRLLELVSPTHVVVSVGSTNSYRHPRPDNIEPAAGKATLGCTQVTGHCHDNVTGPTRCGGTLGFEVSDDGTASPTHGWPTLDGVVDGWAHPMCRRDV